MKNEKLGSTPTFSALSLTHSLTRSFIAPHRKKTHCLELRHGAPSQWLIVLREKRVLGVTRPHASFFSGLLPELVCIVPSVRSERYANVRAIFKPIIGNSTAHLRRLPSLETKYGTSRHLHPNYPKHHRHHHPPHPSPFQALSRTFRWHFCVRPHHRIACLMIV